MKHLKQILIFTSIILISFSGFSQDYTMPPNWVWYFGDGAGLDFSTGTPTGLTNSTMFGANNATEGSATVSDNNGDVLFYTHGSTIFDKTHSVMTNGAGLFGDKSAFQSAVIAPQPPCGSGIYYVFTPDGTSNGSIINGGNLFYHVVDMNVGANGTVTSANNSLLSPVTEAVASIKHANGLDVWILAHAKSSNNWHIYLLTATGVSAGTTQSIGYGIDSYVHDISVSPDGSKVSFCGSSSSMNSWSTARTTLLQFDNSTGVLSNPIILEQKNSVDNQTYDFRTQCFSPNSNVLYAAQSGGNNNPKEIQQFDISNWNQTSIQNSMQVIGGHVSGFGMDGIGQMMLAPDNKIYVAQPLTPNLGTISNPDVLGTGCNYMQSSITLPGGAECSTGLSNSVVVLCTVTTDTILICQGDSLFTGGNWENTAGVYGDTTIQIFTPAITTPGGTICISASPLSLTGTPAGGTWTGTGVTGNSFDPTTAGIGTHLITYTADSIMGSPSITVTCTDTMSITVLTNPSPGTNGTASICSNTVAINLLDSLTGNPDAGGTWSPGLTSGTGMFDPTIDAAGTYTYTITDCAGNPQTANVVVTITLTPNTGTNGAITLCDTDPTIDLFLQLGGAANTGGTWLPTLTSGTGMFDPAIDLAGTYTYSITNSCGTSSNNVIVTITPCILPIAGYTVNDSTICEGTCIDFTDQSTGATSWLWTFNGGNPSTANTQGPHQVCFNTPGLYTIEQIVTNNMGADTITSSVEVYPTPTITASPDVNIDLGESTTLTATGSAGIYTWSPPTWLSCVICPTTVSTPVGTSSNETTTTYTVTVVDSNGCSASDQVNVTLDYDVAIFVPNVFSPNGDGINDILFVRGVGVETINFFIYNRWGEKVFESQDIDHGWDGVYRGEKVNTSVFVYYLEATFINGSKTEQKGDITLIR